MTRASQTLVATHPQPTAFALETISDFLLLWWSSRKRSSALSRQLRRFAGLAL